MEKRWTPSDEKWMREALKMAQEALDDKEVIEIFINLYCSRVIRLY